MKMLKNQNLFKQDRIEFTFYAENGQLEFKFGRIHHLKASMPIEKHVHENAVEVTYMEKGKQVYNVEGSEFEFCSGDFMVVFPNEIHSSGKHFEDKSLFYYLVINVENERNFSGYGKDGARLRSALKNIKQRKFRAIYKFDGLLDQIASLYYSAHPFKELLIESLFTEFVVGIIESEQAVSTMDSEEMLSVVEYIQTHIFDRITVEELAERKHMSVSHFSKVFKRQMGDSVHEYILRRKVEVSKELLRTNEARITQIAHMLGFSSSQYFSTVFKRFTGISPSDFKRNV